MNTQQILYGTNRTRTLLIIVCSMIFIGIIIAVYSLTRQSKTIAGSISKIPTNIVITPGSKSSEKYIELQNTANMMGTKRAENEGKTFVPTIVNNKSTELKNFNNQVSEILKEKQINNNDYERLSKQLALLLNQLNQQGANLDDLLRLIRELQNQGYNVNDLEALLKKLIKDGYNTGNLADLLKQLQQQGYNINDLQALLKKMLAAGSDPNLIDKILSQLLKDFLKDLENAMKNYQNQYPNDLDKIQQLAQMSDQLKQQGYNILDINILFKQLQSNGYNLDKLQDLLSQLRLAGMKIDSLKDLIDALRAQNLLSKPSALDKGLPAVTVVEELPKKSNLSTNTSSSTLSTPTTSVPNNTVEKYQELIKKQQARIKAEEQSKKSAEKIKIQKQQVGLNSEMRKKELEAMMKNMASEVDAIKTSLNKIPTQTFVKGEELATNPTANEMPLNLVAPTVTDKSEDLILKAGTILFAVIQTAVNSDEPGPILAKIVQEPLKNTTLIGTVQGAVSNNSERVSLAFTVANVPDRIRSYSLNAVAIDPETARTAIASDVDHHYLLRWGSIFAATFLKGYASAVAQAGTTNTTTINPTTGTTTTSTSTQNLQKSSKQQLYQGLSNVGTEWSSNISKYSSLPNTITIDPGTSIGILLTSDFTLPASDQSPTLTEKLGNNQAIIAPAPNTINVSANNNTEPLGASNKSTINNRDNNTDNNTNNINKSTNNTIKNDAQNNETNK